MSTTIQVSMETWRRLNRRMDEPQTYDDVVSELLDRVEDNA